MVKERRGRGREDEIMGMLAREEEAREREMERDDGKRDENICSCPCSFPASRMKGESRNLCASFFLSPSWSQAVIFRYSARGERKERGRCFVLCLLFFVRLWEAEMFSC